MHILTQLSSSVSASEKVALVLLKDRNEHCVRDSIENKNEANAKIEELANFVEWFLRVREAKRGKVLPSVRESERLRPFLVVESQVFRAPQEDTGCS